MSTYRNLISLFAAVVFTLGLAACGGGGGTATTDPGPDEAAMEAQALADAQSAARTAWHAARDAVAGIAGKGSADPAAYQRAMNAVADAKAAYDAAMAATTSAEAERQQAHAEAANAVAMAQVAMVVAAYEAPALAGAQSAAMTAADGAKTAYDAAKAALAAVESIKDDDMASYDMAVAEVAKAEAAYMAAKAASDAAAATSNLADAQMHQATAEAELAKANAANTDAMKYAGMVQTAYDNRIADEADAEAMALANAQGAAQTAYDTAKMAYDAAKARFDALETKKADNLEDHVRAMDALTRAKTALDAAMAANDAAQAATTSAEAEMHQATAEARRDDVATQVAGANMYAGLVEAAYDAAQAERDRMAAEAKALADAKKAASDAAMAARTAATQAREQATKVSEALGPNSAQAIAADTAATAAETAATAAEAASALAQDATTSADAIKYQEMAEGEQGKADTQLAAATELAREAGVATAGLDQLRIELARDAAEDAKDAAADAATAARKAATDARTQADNASNEADRANYARTDYANAKMKADAADTAATAAETAATAAETASTNAEAEYMKTMPADVTVEAARMARDEARAQRDAANTQNGEANTQYMAAMTAAGEAMEYANRHVIGLLIHANAQDLDLGDPADVDLMAALDKAKTDRLKAVSDQINMAVGNHAAEADQLGDRDQNSVTTGTTESTSTATASWLGRALDDPSTTDTDESTNPMVSITVAIASGTTSLEWRTEAADADDDTTADVDETIVTATRFDRGLGDFYGYSISDRGNHAIVFTDKKQGADQVAAVTAVTARQVENEAVTAVAELRLGDDKTGPTFTGVTWTPSGEQPLTGTLNCADAANCDISINADGTIATIEGYTFTGSRDAVAAVDSSGCHGGCRLSGVRCVAPRRCQRRHGWHSEGLRRVRQRWRADCRLRCLRDAHRHGELHG